MLIPESFHDLFEKRTFAHFATVMPDGTPQVTPVWIDYDPDAGELLVNTARGRQKDRNVRANPKVGVSMTDPDDPYRYISVRGHVHEVREAGAAAHADTLAERYFGRDEYPHHGEERGPRVIIRIAIDGLVTS